MVELRVRQTSTLERLDHLQTIFDYIPISTPAMIQAANLWALSRQQGQPTADDKSIDADVILAAQAQKLAELSRTPIVVATTNVGHLSRFVDAKRWNEIMP